MTKVASRLATSWYKHTCVPTPVVLVSLSENKMATVFSCVGSSRVSDLPWMENSGWMIAAIVPPFDATLCSGFALCGQGPPGCFAATMSLIGPSGDAAATLVLMGGLAWCGPSSFFQSLLMRLSAAMLAAVVDGPLGFSVMVDDGKMEFVVVVGELSFVSEMQQLTLCDGVKESSSCSPISSCNKGTKSFLKNVEISGWKDMFPKFEQSGCSFLTAGALLDGLAALCGLCWMEVLVMHEAFAKAYDLTDPVFKALRSSTAAVSASAVESDGNVFEIYDQVRRHAHPVVIGHVSSFQQFSNGSCIEVCKSAAVVKSDDCHGSSCNVASTVGDEGEKTDEKLQFFVNYGKGSVVVRCSPHSIVSHVVQYGCEEYAVCGTRTLKSPPPGAGLGPMSTDVGKKDEGGDLAQALSLLQKIMRKRLCKVPGHDYSQTKAEQKKRGNRSWLTR